MSKISRNFFTREFLVSADEPELAARMALTVRDKEHLWPLVCLGLQPARDYFGMPVVVLSGKRSPILNKAVGGWKTSQHLVAAAADFFIPGMKTKELWGFYKYELDWDGQLLFYEEKNFVHLGLPQPGVKRRQFISR